MIFDLNKPIFKTVKVVAAQENTHVYLVGGFVRDLILQRESKDIDFMVIGKGIDFAHKVALAMPKAPKVNHFQNFGTAMFHFDGLDIEFVGARKESYRGNSRNPVIEEGTLEEDLSRRDLTINALAIEIFPNFGKLIDLFGGLSDIHSKTLITPLSPDQTFIDDPLRMMRIIRFAAQLNFKVHPFNFESIKRNAERIRIISTERITDELNKIMRSPTPSIGFKLLFDSGLLKIIFPDIHYLHGVKIVDGKGHKDNFYHTLKVLDNICTTTNDLWLRYAALLHDVAKPATQKFDPEHGWTFHGHEELGAKWIPRIFAKHKLPLNEHMEFVKKMVKLHLRPISLTKTSVTDSAVRRLLFEAGDDIDSLMKLCKADITSKNEFKVKKYRENFSLLEQKLLDVEEKDKLRNWQPPIDGNIIMSTFNITAGRAVGEIKTAIREAILDGNIQNNYEEANKLMLQLGDKMGLKPVDVKN